MSDWQSARWKNTLFAGLATAAFALTSRSITLFVVCSTIAMGSWVVTAGCRQRMLPRWLVIFLLSLTFAGAATEFSQDMDPVDIPPIIGVVVAVALLLRLYARRTVSDERQVLMLASVLLVAAALQRSDLLVGIAIVCATLAAVGCVVRFRLVSQEIAATSEGVGGVAGFAQTSLQSRARWRDLRHTIRIALALVFLLTIGIFVLFPRSSQPTSALFGVSPYGQREFSDRISLMDPMLLTPSQREVLLVEWLGPDDEPPPNQEQIRLRGAVLDRYDRGAAEWFARKSSSQRFVITQPGEFQSLGTVDIDERLNTCTVRILLRGLHSSVVLSPWAPVAIRSPTAQVFTFTASSLALRTLDLDTAGVIVGYDLRVQQYASKSTMDALLGDSSRVPPAPTFPVPAIREAAIAILKRFDGEAAAEFHGGDTPEQNTARWMRNIRLARVFEAELSSDRFRYTLDLRTFVRHDDLDPIELFLNEYRFGHCEYFASALCALCHSVGVDARIVTGFLVDEYDSASGRYIVRESDAHAWVEVRTSDFQWTMIDATPVDDMTSIEPEMGSWTQFSRMLYAPIESLWRDRIAEFDARAQAELMNRVNVWFRDWAQRAWATIEQTARRTSASSQLGVTAFVWIGSVALTIGLSGAAVWMARRRWRIGHETLGLKVRGLTRRDRARARMTVRDAAFYIDSIALLHARGFDRPSHLLPRAFALQLASEHGLAGEVFGEIVERFYAIRFGGQRPDALRRGLDHRLVLRLRSAIEQRR